MLRSAVVATFASVLLAGSAAAERHPPGGREDRATHPRAERHRAHVRGDRRGDRARFERRGARLLSHLLEDGDRLVVVDPATRSVTLFRLKRDGVDLLDRESLDGPAAQRRAIRRTPVPFPTEDVPAPAAADLFRPPGGVLTSFSMDRSATSGRESLQGRYETRLNARSTYERMLEQLGGWTVHQRSFRDEGRAGRDQSGHLAARRGERDVAISVRETERGARVDVELTRPIDLSGA